ncbi:MAG: tRNA-binding protein [Fimbriimonadaceae bacterium]|nr:tRNA-binding protein [Fimbriimonadaceae bacterium]QYK57724.1 MAG: tRNA-binding protein [Fimbriimonadaceae bacterium]
MTATWDDFAKIEIRVGTVVRAEEFPEAKKPAYKLWINFGDHGVKASSAQITGLYRTESLLGRQVVAIVNLPPKQIGPFVSECLVTGFDDKQGNVVLLSPDSPVPNGQRLY